MEDFSQINENIDPNLVDLNHTPKHLFRWLKVKKNIEKFQLINR